MQCDAWDMGKIQKPDNANLSTWAKPTALFLLWKLTIPLSPFLGFCRANILCQLQMQDDNFMYLTTEVY